MGTNSTGVDRRSEILEQIRQCVCVDRCKTHGDAEDNFADIATLWTWWIKARYGVVIQLDALDSAEMMNLMKSTRKSKTPFHLDHWVDGGGYNVCGAGIVKKALDEQAMKKELDGLAPAVDHGEEELKKTEQRGMRHVPTAMICGHAIGTLRCGLILGHSGNHSYA